MRRLPAVLLIALALPALAQARPTAQAPTVPAPSGLHAFLLRSDESQTTTFPRTPSFAWTPVSGAWRYEFQLATSLTFGDGTIVWESSDAAKPLRVPAASVDVALPWITGKPYSLYARVRAVKLVPLPKVKAGAKPVPAAPTVPTTAPPATAPPATAPPATAPPVATPTGKEVFSPWSPHFGFNMGGQAPVNGTSPYPGLVRWDPVEGASGYEVWLFGAAKTFITSTNVADQRDLWTFHRGPLYTSQVQWRVRPVRRLYGEIPSGLPAVSKGPWSVIFTSINPPTGAAAVLWNRAAVSDVVTDGVSDPKPHQLTPGFAFGGDSGHPLGLSPAQAELFRVYVTTDERCVNVVFRGAVVGSPAYAPRQTGPLQLPHTQLEIDALRTGGVLDHGGEGLALMRDGTPAETNEWLTETNKPNSKIDLWDTAWPEGGYYWTVVPVAAQLRGTTIEYRDKELPQDACESGRVMRFGKASPPVLTAASDNPYASGLSPRGRLVAAAKDSPVFYGTPLVAWEPALGAGEYEVQWSVAAYPWRMVGSTTTPSTSALLPLAPGTWYYRVRGLNPSLPKRPQMTWSQPVRVDVAKPKFAVVKK